jgi:hypothetical protein
MEIILCGRFVGARLRDVKRCCRSSALPASNWNLSCMTQFSSNASKGFPMLTMGIAVLAGVFYWLGWYKLAFWILTYAIVYGGLGVLRGDNHTHSLYRQGSGLTIAVLIPVAWHIGVLAGYF